VAMTSVVVITIHGSVASQKAMTIEQLEDIDFDGLEYLI